MYLHFTCIVRNKDRLRPLSYPKTDIFIVAFSLVDRISFNNVYHKWVPEITKYCPEAPFVLRK